MFQKALMLGAVFLSIAAAVSCGSTANHYVYATIPTSNQLAVFREDPNSGVLTELAGSPYSVGDGAQSIVIHPSGKFLYVANPGEGANGENDISLFNIQSNGGLTEVFPRTTLTSGASVPRVLLMDPAGAYLYVLDAGSETISVFGISSSGALSEITGSPFTIGGQPLNMALNPAGNLLYVTTTGTLTSGVIIGFSVSAGQLTLIGLTPSNGLNPFGIAVNSSGTYLYTANTSSNSISIFGINADGSLSSVPGSPLNDGYSSPINMVFDATGDFLYVANQGSSNITAYAIDSTTGLPSALNSSTATNAYGTNTNPAFLAIDPDGKYLFVGNQNAGHAAVQALSINDGGLTILTNYGVGNSASSIAVLK